jgi:SRSO17 transposase
MAIPKAGSEPLAGLGSFLEPYSVLVRRAESRHALERYTTGLLSDLSRKTASDLGRAIPDTNGQRLQEFLTRTAWDAAEMDRLRIKHMVEHARVGGGALVIDDTGFAKKGTHSVGVTRQYSGTLGRVDNCQVMVSAHYVDRVFDWPVTARLYLPEEWANDRARRARMRVPEDLPFQTKGEIALTLIDRAGEAGVRPSAVVTDAGYGDQGQFLDGLDQRHLPYVVGVKSSLRFRTAEAVRGDSGEAVAPAYSGRGRPRRNRQLQDRVSARDARSLLAGVDEDAWSTIGWREGTKGALVKQFVRVRVYRTGPRGAHIDSDGWLIGERPIPGHAGDKKCYFAHALDESTLEDLVDLAHVRWVVERFYQDAKGELGLDDYEGRFWTGFHRHVALVMLAHSYLTLRQSYGPEVTAQSPPDAGAITPPPSSPHARGFPPSSSTKHRSAPKRGSRGAVPTGGRKRHGDS